MWNDRLTLSSHTIALRGGSSFGFPQAGTRGFREWWTIRDAETLVLGAISRPVHFDAQ